MTLTQLEALVLVARLGSVTAAARALGVSEPAVSGALASLRQQLGDRLIERRGNGMVLTTGGQRFLPIASQMVALGAEAERVIRQAQGAPERLRVVATSTVAESTGPALLAAFSARTPAIEVSLGVASSDEMAALLQERLADVALGPRLSGPGAGDLESVPLFRYRLVFVTHPANRLARCESLALRALAAETWLVDPDATDAATPVARILRQLEVPERNIRVFASQAAAWDAAELGQGVAPAVAHLVGAEARRGLLVPLNVRGTPVPLMWYATMLPPGQRTESAAGLRRFVATPDATHAMHAPMGGVTPSRFRPPVYVTIWS